jgi:hypothetical protein
VLSAIAVLQLTGLYLLPTHTQVNATSTLNSVNNTLDQLPVLVDVSITRLNSLASEVMDINLVTEKAPEVSTLTSYTATLLSVS